MEIILIYSLISAALFYLGSRAVITQWLWSRYPRRFAKFMDCASCTGLWFGLFTRIAFQILDDKTTFSVISRSWLVDGIFLGLCTMTLTPIVAGLMQAGFEKLGDAVGEDAEKEA